MTREGRLQSQQISTDVKEPFKRQTIEIAHIPGEKFIRELQKKCKQSTLQRQICKRRPTVTHAHTKCPPVGEHIHQPTAWPLLHACSQPYQTGSGSHGQLFCPYWGSSAWHSRKSVTGESQCRKDPFLLRRIL